MARHPKSADFTVGVLGAGAMGRGIAQIMAAGGMRVVMFDTQQGAAEAGRAFAERMIRRAAEKGAMAKDDAEAAVGRMRVAAALDGLADADLVIEAVIEDLSIKRQVVC